MIKRATLIWMFLTTAAGIGLFVLKYEVKSMEGQLATIHENSIKNPLPKIIKKINVNDDKIMVVIASIEIERRMYIFPIKNK